MTTAHDKKINVRKHICAKDRYPSAWKKVHGYKTIFIGFTKFHLLIDGVL